jgi:jumonji domain-containing protein 7
VSLELSSSNVIQVQIDAWFSGDGVTAETHYDTMHNFYTVIQGSKTFQLSPPAAHSRMSLYPTLHAAYRQVQVRHPLSTHNALHGTKGSNHGSALNITLHRGDVLFLPAYWFHRVVSHVSL